MLGLLEGEGEGVEQLVRAEPDEATAALLDVGLEHLGIALADAAVEPVTGDHQVGAVLGCQRLVVGGIALEHQLHAQRQAALLQDVEQALAPDAAKAVATGAHATTFEKDFDVVPVVEGLADQLGCRRVRGRQVGQRLVAQHHAPAEGVEGPIALDHGDLKRRPLLLQKQGKVQTGGPAADAEHALKTRSKAIHG